MSITEMLAAIGPFSAAVATIVAAITFIYTWNQYRKDQTEQRAAQTREALQAIIGDCSRFLRPLSEQYPYPILHTATAITREFCSRMAGNPRGKDVQELLSNKELLLSICVEGWINSTQIFRMLTIAEELERKASSHYLRGKLLLICNASFFLAGLVALVCSPESFYNMLYNMKIPINPKDKVENVLNAITVKLQNRICQDFNDNYSQTIHQSLNFIQTAANAFISLSDECLVNFAKAVEEHAAFSSSTDLMSKSEQEALLREHLKYMKKLLNDLDPDSRNQNSIGKTDYTNLCNLIDLISERWKTESEVSHDKEAAIA